jgi:periplasmic protein TonB
MRLTAVSGDSHHLAAGIVRPNKITRIGLRAALVLALALSACGSPEPPAPAATPATAPAVTTSAAPTVAPVVDARTSLALANAAFRENRIVAPAGNNALEHALHALKQEPDNAGATEILVDLTPIAAAAIEADIAAGNYTEAERVMALLTQANPGSLTVQGLQRRMATATRPAPAPVVAETATAEPAAAPAVVVAPVASRDVAPAPSRDTAAASAPVRSAPASPATAATAEPTPAIPEPVVASRPPPAAPAAPVSRASEPVPLVKVSPEYPAAAKKRRTEGWVELQFLVGVDGIPRNIEVLRAQPPGMFDRAAIRAMTRWKFKPAERDGQPVEARAKTTVGFKLG